jgi:hypothetical protein
MVIVFILIAVLLCVFFYNENANKKKVKKYEYLTTISGDIYVVRGNKIIRWKSNNKFCHLNKRPCRFVTNKCKICSQ